MNNQIDKDEQEQKALIRKESMDQFLASAVPKKKGVGGIIGDTLLSGLASAVAVPELAVGLSDITSGGRTGKFADEVLGFRPKEAKEAIAGWKSEEAQSQLRNFQETEGFGAKLGYALKNPSLISGTVVESLAPMLAGGVVGRGIAAAAPKISPVLAGAIGEGTVGAGMQAESIRQQTEDGLLTGKQTGIAAATGLTTAGFGFAGGQLAKKLGVGDFETIIAGGGRAANPGAEVANAASKGFLRRGAEGALTEGLLEELPQSVSETILQNEALGRPLDEGVTDAAALGLLSGMAMGGFAGGFSRNRATDGDITPTEDMGQEAPRLGLPNPNRPDGNQLGYQGAISDPNNPNWIEDGNPDYFNRGQGPDAANMRNLTPDLELPYNSELGGQFSAASDGTVFSEAEYNDYLAQQQAQARASRDAGLSDVNDITPVPEGYDRSGSDPRLPPPRSDFEVTSDGTALTSADSNTVIQNERAANAERMARRLRGEIQDNTPIPNEAMGFGDVEPVDNRKLSERMGLDPNKGGLSAAAAIAVDSGASSVAADFEQSNAPTQSAWQSGMMDRLSNADQSNSTYARLAQAMQNEPTSVSEKSRLMREADELPRAEVAAKQIKPKTRVLDEAKAQTKAYTPEGQEVQAQWDVVDASDLVTSNTDNFTINPDFPSSRQPRDRTRASSQQQVNDIASKLQPNLLGESPDVSTGAPFVGANDNVVDSGNGRTMAIRRVYQEGSEKAQAYRQFVNEQAGKFGLDTDAINMMQSPVLVRRNTSDMNRDEFARAANKPTAARMSSTEQATSDAKNLPDASLLSFDGEGSMSLYQSQKYLKNFIAGLPKTEQGSLMDDKGALSREGKSRIEAAIVQDAYNNPRLVSAISEKLDNDTTNVLRAVTDKAPQISQINASIRTGDVYENTLARDIADATQAYMDVRNSGKDINDYLSQDSLLGDGLTDGAKEILTVLSDNRRSAKAIGEYIQQRINAVTGRGNPKQGGLSFDDVETSEATQTSEAEPIVSNNTEASLGGMEAQTKKPTQLTDDNPTVNIPAPTPEVTTNDTVNTTEQSNTTRDAISEESTDTADSQNTNDVATVSDNEVNPPKTYAQVQTEVADEMGITTNEDGEYDISDSQFDTMEGRVRERMEAEPQSQVAKSETAPETKETTAKKADKPATPTAPVAEIEDFGEKIVGARKDMDSFYQREITDDDISNQPLSKIWPKKDIEAIEDKQTAALATVLRGTIPSKPRQGYNLKGWVEKVKSARGIMQQIMNDGEMVERFIDSLTKVKSLQTTGYHAQLLTNIDRKQWSRVTAVDHRPYYTVKNDDGSTSPDMSFDITIDKRRHIIPTENKQISEVVDRVNELLSGEVKAPTLKFDLYSRGRGDTKSWFITQASDKDKTALIEFNDRDTARAFLKENNADLTELWDQHKDKVNVKKSDMRSNANRERIGPDHRSGQDVTTEQFMNTFGLRGGQFGNWVKQGANSKDRQNMLNDAYDAFMDLAGVLNIPPEAIGLGGKLAMSFGARGKGRAMAHYEPSQVIINLTKTKGAGSLAHEWFHALDHHFTSFRDSSDRNKTREATYITYQPEPSMMYTPQKGRGYLISKPALESRQANSNDPMYNAENWAPDPAHPEGVRPQVEEVFADLVKTLDESPMKERATTIDKGAPDGYWSRIIERAARAFESYVINKLEKQGARSDFLANVTPEDAFPRNMDRYPYLLESEMAPVAEAFDNLFATLDSKASEDGNGKTLFSRAGQMKQTMDNVKAGAIGSTQTTRQQVISKLSDKFGKETIAKLMADGKLDIKVLSDYVVDGKLTIPSDVDGLYHNGKAVLIADNLSDDMIIPTFLHELGGHGGMQGLMDKKAYDALMKDFDSLVKAGDPLAMQAKAMADKVARNEQDALDEYLPYLITLASRQQAKTGKVAGMINRMVMAIRLWLKNTLGAPITINSQDILSLAERMVNEIEKQGSLDNVANAAPQFSDPNIPDKQMQDVRDQYENTDQWMKAPNGKPTNLTENQWVQTRTPAFKEWFGDWQNDPKNASKIVDDNGEPKVMYHGTGQSYNIFDDKVMTWTADDKILAGRYAHGATAKNWAENKETIIPLFMNAKKPFNADKLEGVTSINKFVTQLFLQGDVENSGYTRESRREIIKELNELEDNHGRSKQHDTHNFWHRADANIGKPTKEYLDRVIANLGFDSISFTEDGIFTTGSINPNQIKSATDNVGTFDPNNNDIRYSRAGGMADQFDPINIMRESKQRLFDWASSAPPGKLSWWHKTIGTMYNLAQRNPYFKPVFDNTEKFINDVSYYASKASEFAPRLLPQLDSIRDITKSAIGAKDNEALSKPIFEGTLLWGRDLDGKAVLIEDWRKKVMATSKQDRLKMLQNAGRITPAQEAELATLNNIQANRFINGIIDEEVNAGLVWTDNELRSKFNLDDKQIELYREFRAATDKSLDSLTRSDMLRKMGKDANDIESQVMEVATLREAVFVIEQHINSLIQASPKKEKSLKATLKDIKESKFRTDKLKDDGYAPLSRFGQYTVDVVDSDGNREYFGMFESAYEARKMKAEMDALYGNDQDYTVTQGALSNEEFKLFAGVTPETAELFGEMLGLDATGDKAADEAFQEYLKRTKNNRSAMKRLMHRKGIKGYSEDVGRVLASFIYSNARHTSAALNMGNLDRSIADIPKGEGQLKDAAVKLAQYIKNPQEEGQLIRGWMFAQYLGGSIASAAVNLTQPIAVSFPYLSQFGGAVKAASQLKKSSGDWIKAFTSKSRDHFEPDLLAAIERAEADGTLSPQEVHNLLKQASGKNPLSAGDGTKVGDAKALASNSLSRASLAWGVLFSGAEQINRRVTFVAAYRLAKDQGMDDPADFATKSIKETQFVYNKASRMNWGRGMVGGTLMTFKTYTVSYMELMHRLWTQGEKGSVERKQGQKAVGIMLGTLFLLGGAGGLPFMEDAEDLIDGIGQIMGYNFSSKKVRQDFLDEWVGEMAGDFIDGGISSVSGSPTDVSGRLGLGNLIPGTGIFKERTSNSRDVLEIVGPAGDFVGRVATGTRDIAKGVANLDSTSLKKGALEFAPTAVRNAVKGTSMATSGIYKDTKGYKVADVSPIDAAFKFVGFQPRDISKIQEANYLGQSSTSYYNLRASSIRALWAAGVVEGNESKVADAKAAVKDWNEKNPNQKIIVKPNDIARRVREMRMDKSERVVKRAPKSSRGILAQDLAKAGQ